MERFLKQIQITKYTWVNNEKYKARIMKSVFNGVRRKTLPPRVRVAGKFPWGWLELDGVDYPYITPSNIHQSRGCPESCPNGNIHLNPGQ